MKRQPKEYEAMIQVLIEKVKMFFADKPKDSKAIIGMSGGKDSTFAAEICVQALGKDRVLGFILENDIEKEDTEFAEHICLYLGIQYRVIPINKITNACYTALYDEYEPIDSNVLINTPPRIRMTMLYALAAMYNGYVINTSNRSEAVIGYCTKWGDNVGDLFLLRNTLCTDIPQMGIMLGIPEEFMKKPPSDGLSGQTDEEKLGFTYEEVDEYITNNGANLEQEVFEKIHKKELANQHKKFFLFLEVKIDDRQRQTLRRYFCKST